LLNNFKIGGIKMKIFTILLLILSFVNKSIAVSVNGSPSSVLTFDGMGSRSLALNESVVAIGSGSEAISANPALISKIDKLNLSVMYLSWFESMSYIYFAGAMPVPAKSFKGVVGLSIASFNSGNFDKFSEGSSSPENISANDYSIALGYARGIDDKSAIGVNLKFAQSTLDKYSANAILLDLGGTYSLAESLNFPILLAFAVQNIGTSFKFDSENSPAPMNIKVGIGYNKLLAKSHNLTADIEGNFPNDSGTIARIGIEYSFISKVYGLKLFSLRVGLQPIGRANNLFTLGVGSELPLSQYVKDYQFNIDYALVPAGELGLTHSVTVSMIFKEDVEKLFGLSE